MSNIENLSITEMRNTNGGVVGVIIGATVAYMAIIATLAWEMEKIIEKNNIINQEVIPHKGIFSDRCLC